MYAEAGWILTIGAFERIRIYIFMERPLRRRRVAPHPTMMTMTTTTARIDYRTCPLEGRGRKGRGPGAVFPAKSPKRRLRMAPQLLTWGQLAITTQTSH